MHLGALQADCRGQRWPSPKVCRFPSPRPTSRARPTLLRFPPGHPHGPGGPPGQKGCRDGHRCRALVPMPEVVRLALQLQTAPSSRSGPFLGATSKAWGTRECKGGTSLPEAGEFWKALSAWEAVNLLGISRHGVGAVFGLPYVRGFVPGGPHHILTSGGKWHTGYTDFVQAQSLDMRERDLGPVVQSAHAPPTVLRRKRTPRMALCSLGTFPWCSRILPPTTADPTNIGSQLLSLLSASTTEAGKASFL